MTQKDIQSAIKKASDKKINQIAQLMGWSPQGEGYKYFENKYLLRTAVSSVLCSDDKNINFLNAVAVYELIIQLMEKQAEESAEVTRQMQIMRINTYIRNNRGGIKLADYDLFLDIQNRSVSIIQEDYVFIEDNLGDDDIQFDDMDDDEIDSIHEIIDQMDIIDEKTMKRSEN